MPTAVVGNSLACRVGVINWRIPRSESVLGASRAKACRGRMIVANLADMEKRMMDNASQ